MEYDKLFPDFPGQDGDVSTGFEDRVWKKIRRKKIERRVMAGSVISLAVIVTLFIMPGKSGQTVVTQAQLKEVQAVKYDASQEEIAVNAEMIHNSTTGETQYAVHPVVYKPHMNRF